MNKKTKILVNGAVAIDSIFELTSDIRDHINFKDGKSGFQNLMFIAREKKEYFGGPASNIAFGLGLLNCSSFLASVAGKDFAERFKKHLEEKGVISHVLEDKNGFTATYYGMTDTSGQQMGIFQPNAYSKIETTSLLKMIPAKKVQEVDIAIFSPGTAKSTSKFIVEFRKNSKKNALVIFDPGQGLMATFTKDLFKKVLNDSDILIGNETEIGQIKNHFGFSFDEIFRLGVSSIIETIGKDGSILHTKSGSKKISAIKVKKVVDPTGAGDAFRAGLIFGLSNKKTIEESMKIGAVLGAECVKHFGGQTYSLPKNLK